jgi:hypothetical protein
VLAASDDERGAGCHREAATNSEWSYVAYQRRAQVLSPCRTTAFGWDSTFQNVIRDELGSYGVLWQGPIYPAYLRGEAYLRLRNGSAAAAVFQKFVDHRAVLANFPTGSLAHLGLARAYGCKATTAKPALHTKTFSRFGKMPIPISWSSKQAKAEYAKLR